MPTQIPKTLDAWIKLLDSVQLPVPLDSHERVKAAIGDSRRSLRDIADLMQDSPALVLSVMLLILANRDLSRPALLGVLFHDAVDGKPVPLALIEKGVVPFIKIDKGLENEENGVQLMKQMPELDALLEKSKALGVYGTKERSVINSANREGIAAVVKQQFEVGNQVLAHGMMPMIEPEVNIKSETRAECDAILLDEILKALDALPVPTAFLATTVKV